MVGELKRRYPETNIVPIDYDPGASQVNQLNRMKLMLSVAFKNLEQKQPPPDKPQRPSTEEFPVSDQITAK